MTVLQPGPRMALAEIVLGETNQYPWDGDHTANEADDGQQEQEFEGYRRDERGDVRHSSTKRPVELVDDPVHRLLQGNGVDLTRRESRTVWIDEGAGPPRGDAREEGSRILVVGCQESGLSVGHDRVQALAAIQVQADQGHRDITVRSGPDGSAVTTVVEPHRADYLGPCRHDDKPLIDVERSAGLADLCG